MVSCYYGNASPAISSVSLSLSCFVLHELADLGFIEDWLKPSQAKTFLFTIITNFDPSVINTFRSHTNNPWLISSKFLRSSNLLIPNVYVQIYFLDTQVWYTVVSALVGGFDGARMHLGEVIFDMNWALVRYAPCVINFFTWNTGDYTLGFN